MLKIEHQTSDKNTQLVTLDDVMILFSFGIPVVLVNTRTKEIYQTSKEYSLMVQGDIRVFLNKPEFKEYEYTVTDVEHNYLGFIRHAL